MAVGFDDYCKTCKRTKEFIGHSDEGYVFRCTTCNAEFKQRIPSEGFEYFLIFLALTFLTAYIGLFISNHLVWIP